MKQIYDIVTGEILRTVVCSSSQYQYQAKTGEGILAGGEVGADNTHYVLNGVLTAKIENPAIADKISITADGVDKVTISEIYNPSEVIVSYSAREIVTDGIMEITADDVCVIKVRCRSVPYLDKEFIINAT